MAYDEFGAESCQSAFWTMCRLPKIFHKFNFLMHFGRIFKEWPGRPGFFRVRVADQAVDMGQIIYIDEMFIINSEIGGGAHQLCRSFHPWSKSPIWTGKWGTLGANNLYEWNVHWIFRERWGDPSLESLAIHGLDPHLNRYLGDLWGRSFMLLKCVCNNGVKKQTKETEQRPPSFVYYNFLW